MVSLFALYQRPSDERAFLDHYAAVHVPLAQKMPGLISLEWGLQTLLSQKTPDPWFLVAEMRFPDRETLMAALSSAEGKAAGRDLDSFAKDLVTMRMVEWQ